jgi:hypothetical protein
MSPFRYRDDESSTGTTVASVLFGAIAGFAVGMYVAQRVGGFRGLTEKFRRGRAVEGSGTQYEIPADEFDELEDAEDADEGVTASSAEDEDFNGMDDDGVPLLEERVLEAFNNDPILAERAIDIGSMGDGIIELAGWVDNDDEAEHAMTIARGVPGVQTVVNRLMVDEEEEQIGDNVRRFKDGDPAMTESGWEGQQVGTGKRRQGSSDELDRHADPKPLLEDRWLSESEALKNAADEMQGIAERRKKGAKGAKGAAKADRVEPQQEA